MTDKTDPVADLAAGIAADHATEKNKGKGSKGAKAAAPAAVETTKEPGESSFLGDFDSFDAVREFANGEGFNINPGDMTVINGALVKYNGKGTFDTVVDSLLDEYGQPADHVETFTRGVTEIERVVLAAQFESGTLKANVRDLIIEIFKARPKKWTEMSSAEQRELGKQIEAQATTIIRKVARVVAEGEDISIVGKLERYTHSGSFDLKISAPAELEAATQLFNMQGHDIVIISADAKRFLEGGNDVVVMPDEPELFPDVSEPAAEQQQAPEHPADDSDLGGEDAEEVEENEAPADNVVQLKPEAAETGAEEVAQEDAADSGEAQPFVSLVDQVRADPADGEPNDYESRQNPDDEVEEPAADFKGDEKPDSAQPGQTWLKTSDPRLRWMHPNMKWYLQAPTEEVLEAWRVANHKSDNEDGLTPLED